MSIIIKIGTYFLNFIYTFMKILPVQEKITYISRQMNTIPKDFEMVIKCIQEKDKHYKHVVLARMIPNNIVENIVSIS